MLITGRATLTDAVDTRLQKTTAIFAITLGKDGTLPGMNGETVIVPTTAVKPIDTTGAGDAFVGTVLFQLSTLSHHKYKNEL